MDENRDSDAPPPVEILTAQALIAEYETRAPEIFGVSKVNLELLQRMRALFLTAEIKETAMRYKASPYWLERPEDLGAKGPNAVTPFMLSLERLDKALSIDEYWNVFLLFGAAIQMIDDWTDLEKDLEAGHYSYIPLGLENVRQTSNPKETEQQLRSDSRLVHSSYDKRKEMVAEAPAMLVRLNNSYLTRLVDVTEARLNSYFGKN